MLSDLLQMPAGVPVATVALNGAQNAGVLAAQILGASDKFLATKLEAYKRGLSDKVKEGIASLKLAYPNTFDQ